MKTATRPNSATPIKSGALLCYARDRLLSFACLLWPDYDPAAHHRLIAKKLERVERGKLSRLMIFMPPRHGKSLLCSEFFVAWYIGRNPEKQVIFATYSQDLADDFGRRVRNWIRDPAFQAIFPGVTLAEDSQAASRFNVGARGSYFAVGVGGSITGRGADCLTEGTLIETAEGPIAIENLKIGSSSGIILSLNHRENVLEYKNLKAIASRSADGFFRITTRSGNVIEVTDNHRIFVNGQYKTANSVSTGDAVVLVLPSEIRPSGLSVFQERGERASGPLLREELLGISSRNKEREAVREMRAAGRLERSMSRCSVLRWMSSKTAWEKSGSPAKRFYMPYLWCCVLGEMAWSWFWKIRYLLQKTLRGNRAFAAHGWTAQPEMEGWSYSSSSAISFGESVQGNAFEGSGSRWSLLRGVPIWKQPAGGPPHRRLADEQLSVKSGYAVLEMPQKTALGEGFKAISDTVALVERVRKKARVYDIQVDGNNNFFANGVCVHNCLIIDDPLKGREEADSETVRRKLKAWYTSVAYTRLMPGAAIVLIQTRWHPEDLGGWLLKEHQHERWKPLSLSALSDTGTALWPKRYPVSALERIKETLPNRDWSALYQQSPIIDGGNILKKKWWREWTKIAPVCSYIIQSWDTAYSDADLKTNSYSARTTWGVFRPTEDEIAIILIEAWHDRVDYPELKKEALKTYRDHNPDCVLIEKKASGQSLIQDLRKDGVPVATYQPDRDKVARAYAVQAMLECGQIYYPARRWADDVIDECAQFPNGAYSDWVDTCTQAWLRIRNSGMLGKIIREPKSPDELEELFPNQGKSEPMRGGVYG